jgi:hypothetical protein
MINYLIFLFTIFITMRESKFPKIKHILKQYKQMVLLYI